MSVLVFIMLVSLTNAQFSAAQLSTSPTVDTCTYCQTTACHCPFPQVVLNCSQYLLELPFIASCAEGLIWETVDFSSRNLRTLDANKLVFLRAKRLLLNANSITDIQNQTFDATANVLLELDLAMNQLTHVSSAWLNSKLVHLERLNLASNELKSFNGLDQVQLPNLRELNLSRNQIDVFPSYLYQWTSLKKLDLSFNRLSSVPRFSLVGLNNLTWLSLASNRDLNCIVQDSVKHLKSLQYLDLSSTNLFNFDACLFVQLTGLKVLRFEHIAFNCTSCWLPVARKNALQLSGHCLNNSTVQSFDSLTDQQLQYGCSKLSIDCSSDHCEPGSSNNSEGVNRSPLSTRPVRRIKTRTVEIILGIVFSLITLLIAAIFIVLISRWKQGRPFFCCRFSQTAATGTTIAEATRRRRQHHKQIIDSNPVVIESVITHGANMNVPPYPHQNYAYFNDEASNNKRKLYNPMFADSPALDIRQQQLQSQPVILIVAEDSISENSQFYSEHL